MPIQVSYLERAAGVGHSIHRLFESIRQGLPPDVIPVVFPAPLTGTSPLTILRNCWAAYWAQGQVNHVTGDVHYLTFLLRRRRTVLTIHDCVVLNRLSGWRRSILYWLWYRLPIWRAGAITTISEEAKRELLSYVPVSPDRIRVVPNCVGDEFQPTAKARWPEKPTLLQVGTGANKNLENVARAIRGFNCHLRILGRLTEQQHQFLSDCNVDYSHTCDITDDDVRREYEEADMVVFASTYEGFGLPILETQAVGRPLVTSQLPPMCVVAGKGASLVDPFDVNSIRHGLERIANEPAYRENLIRHGFENVKQYRSDRIAAEYVEIYQELLRRDP